MLNINKFSLLIFSKKVVLNLSSRAFFVSAAPLDHIPNPLDALNFTRNGGAYAKYIGTSNPAS